MRFCFFISLVLVLCGSKKINAQSCSKLNIQLQSSISSACNQMTMTMLFDQRNKPYLYVANKEGGFKAYDITDITNPVLIKSISIDSLGKSDVMSLSQTGDYIYLALGNHFGTGKNPGMAIVDVTDPKKISLRGKWKSSRTDGGAGIVKAEGNYAYLGAMKQGVVLFDVSDKDSIKYLSEIKPDINFPDAKADSNKVNARGMMVKNDIIYLCYDAGGLRIINTKDKKNPKETGRYCNPVLKGKPRAYNNIEIDDTLAYISSDFCGLEVLNIKDTTNITQVAWYNPVGCETNGFKWFSSPMHTNEMHLDKDCKLLFISTGKSDMYVMDVTNPKQPDSCNYYGGVSNNLGTWGISVMEGKIALSYVCAAIPFSSNWTGVKLLKYNDKCSSGIETNELKFDIALSPNPANTKLTISLPEFFKKDENSQIILSDLQGRQVETYNINFNDITIDISCLNQGMYIISLRSEKNIYTTKFFKY